MVDKKPKTVIQKNLFSSGGLFTFILTTFFGAIWLDLLNLIQTLTFLNSANPILFPLGLIHCITFIYFILSLILFYETGLLLIKESDPSNNSSRSNKFNKLAKDLLITWPAVFIACIAVYLIGKISPISSIINWTAIIFVIIFPLTAFFIRKRVDKLYELGLISMGILLFYLFLYLPFVSFIASDIEIETDREFYSYNDNIVLSVRGKGYIFSPEITGVFYGNFPVDRNLIDNSFSEQITLKFCPGAEEYISKKQYLNFIKVEYFPMSGMRIMLREKYGYLKIVE